MFECLFQCDNKEHFIERIKGMDLEVQKLLVEYIQQVIDFCPSTITLFITGHHRNYRKKHLHVEDICIHCYCTSFLCTKFMTLPPFWKLFGKR